MKKLFLRRIHNRVDRANSISPAASSTFESQTEKEDIYWQQDISALKRSSEAVSLTTLRLLGIGIHTSRPVVLSSRFTLLEHTVNSSFFLGRGTIPAQNYPYGRLQNPNAPHFQRFLNCLTIKPSVVFSFFFPLKAENQGFSYMNCNHICLKKYAKSFSFALYCHYHATDSPVFISQPRTNYIHSFISWRI